MVPDQFGLGAGSHLLGRLAAALGLAQGRHDRHNFGLVFRFAMEGKHPRLPTVVALKPFDAERVDQFGRCDDSQSITETLVGDNRPADHREGRAIEAIELEEGLESGRIRQRRAEFLTGGRDPDGELQRRAQRGVGQSGNVDSPRRGLDAGPICRVVQRVVQRVGQRVISLVIGHDAVFVLGRAHRPSVPNPSGIARDLTANACSWLSDIDATYVR